ncbi:hypothetical protein CROQUDRAFT_654524 [Cronartium quercuum f. sp. fusiforme G11]|uniref:S-adenosyl-L-methionine-dependent methyltransferase n=1 Tax=Cronartium quercuum f. sp. fusiforme G11 TaxID=708437 RepID=A0A9P6NKH6_9BASI|nr:hypothetical protein CROQUDRAFT_654524 [Cronartium quercuum f. sp. fusiforme G11]
MPSSAVQPRPRARPEPFNQLKSAIFPRSPTPNCAPDLVTICLVSFGLALASPSCQLALYPLFGATATRYYFSQVNVQIDCILTPLLHFFFPSISPAITLLLSAFTVHSAPQIVALGLSGLSGRYGALFGPIALQSALYWPLRLLGMLATSTALENAWSKMGPKKLPKPKGLFRRFSYIAVRVFALRINVVLLYPLVKWFLDLIPACRTFAVVSTCIFFDACLVLVLQYRNMRLVTLVLFFTLAIGFILIPAPQSLCLDEPAPKNGLTSPTGSGKLLARRQSVTGLVAVGEYTVPETGEEFRYLRCDHSLLGGLWTGPARESAKARGLALSEGQVMDRAESIYATFVLQEAIRLVDRPTPARPTALIIGLGIGVSARSLMRHGVQVTVVELDPVVYEYARRFFALPKPSGGVYLEDAGGFVDRRGHTNETYDYIIHDVFTGGSVPGSLFTHGFWSSIKILLKSDGVLAVNFAGKPTGQAGMLVLSTLFSVFPHCRIFSEKTDEPKTESDFQNLVVFCMPDTRPEFRPLTEADVFGSRHRYWILNNLTDQELMISGLPRSNLILNEKSGNELELAQIKSAIDHWGVMREVLSDSAWENFY